MSDQIKNDSCGTSCGCESETPKYWQDVENKVLPKAQLTQEFSTEEFDSFSVKKSRRNFLKIMGFSVGALPLTGCIKIPVRKALPYLNKVEGQIPGVASWYGTTFNNNPILVKTREGRPIKVEGNALSVVSKGGACAQDQASVISLYDSYRYRSAMLDGNAIEWDAFDTELLAAAKKAKAAGKDIVVVTPTVKSPSMTSLLRSLGKANINHVAYDATSNYSMAKANERTHGVFNTSEYDFANADVVVSFGADFLGTWGNGVAASKQYSSRRRAEDKNLNKHIHFEASMSMTGSNADHRFTKSVKDQRAMLVALLNTLSGKAATTSAENKASFDLIVKELKGAKNSVVVCGDTNIDTQVIVNKINDLLGNYGKSVFVKDTNYVIQANDKDFSDLIAQMSGGKVGMVVFAGVNPAYDYFNTKAFTAAMSKVDTCVSTATAENETSKLCKLVAPSNHQFESWGDNYVSSDEISFTQPVIQPLFGSRMSEETLMVLGNISGTYYDFMRNVWKNDLYKKSSGFKSFDAFWNKALHDGVAQLKGLSVDKSSRNFSADNALKALGTLKYSNGMHIVTYQKYAIGNGEMANNPFLQEMPDPITKATWDNYIMVSAKYAKANKIKSGDVLELTSGDNKIKLPAVVQPGTAENTVAVALGYGHTTGGKVATGLGANAYTFVSFANGAFDYSASFGTIKKTGAFRGLALTQTHHSMEGRDIVRETTDGEYKKNAGAGNKKKVKYAQIYPAHAKDGHQWAMAIDLSTCTGCSSCIVSCNAENNVPVVGRTEVHRRREMHWLRIDRYYSGTEENPETVHMPMLCQHCENAPCENVCPVLATTHSSDGLNQQIYNRCVGTRYCANNCPYKVRRFNWFNYDRGDDVARLALNPDVTQRHRGVMEKCSMCVQRIQEGKLEAKKERRALKDGDIKLACQQSCPTDGIVFGDMNDENSQISKFLKNERNYTVLEELNVKPRVSYLVKVRNK